MAKKTIVILAEGFEEIEAITVIDILRRAGISVTVAGVTDIKVKGSHNIIVLADKKLDEIEPDHDACVLPGGMPGAANLVSSQKVRSVITAMHEQGKIVAAICAAPSVILAPLGVLKERSATGYPGMEKSSNKETAWKEDEVVVDGNIITSQGPATAIPFALAIAEKLAGKEIAKKVGKAALFLTDND
ncbi:MAG: DJ-1/PfpI family protein [Candidatus Omnitrophica bacterium]|nr:DJ-1/PfpI family protein [Candidatus Omnitrophota bacterium]